MTKILYPIRTVAKLTGVSLDTLRAWERRYSAVTPERGARGRLYGEVEIQRLTLLRDAVECGHAIGQIAGMEDSHLRELIERSSGGSADMRRRSPLRESSEGTWVPILSAVERFESAEVSQELGRLSALLSSRDLIFQVILPLVRAVAEGLNSGHYTLAQERFLAVAARNLLGTLLHQSASHSRHPHLLLATQEDDFDELGILTAAVLAADRSLTNLYLGPSLPAQEILLAVERRSPRVVLLGISRRSPAPATLRDVRHIAAGLPPQVEFWVLGEGIVKLPRQTLEGRIVLLDELEGLELHLARLAG
jgi:DNA-binding transcriptional MerR regulator